MLWIRIDFNVDPDPDPACYLNADPDTGSQISADPDPNPGQTLNSQKVTVLHGKCQCCGSGFTWIRIQVGRLDLERLNVLYGGLRISKLH